MIATIKSSGRRPIAIASEPKAILRFLTADDPDKAERCKQLFMKAQQGNVSLYTSDLVIAELVWILQSPRHYGLGRTEIQELLLPLVIS
jgi:predicted nucleic acid-binding protein